MLSAAGTLKGPLLNHWLCAWKFPVAAGEKEREGGRSEGRDLFCRAERQVLTFSIHTAETRRPSCTKNKNILPASYPSALPLL